MLPLLVLTVLLGASAVRAAPPPAKAVRPHKPTRPIGNAYGINPVLPAPRATRQIPGWIRGESTVEGLRAATPETLVVQIVNRRDEVISRRIVALNRSVNNLHWEKEPEGINLPGQSIRAYWDVLGSVSAKNGKPVAEPIIVLGRQVNFVHFAPKTNPTYETDTAIYGVDEASRIKWQYPAQTGPPNTTVSAGQVVGGLLPVRVAGGDDLTLWDAQTGLPIDRATPAGQAAVQDAIHQNGSPLMQAWERLYRLDTGVSFPAPHKPVGDENLVPLGVTFDRAFWQAGGDDGFMGHSSWPTYLIASDENGRLVWQFPDSKEQNFANGGINSPSIGSLTLTNAGSDAAIAVVFLTHGINTAGVGGELYGLRVRDGKRLWKRTLPDFGDIAAQARNFGDVFLLHVRYNKDGGTEKVQLEYLNAATGKTRKTWRLPEGVNRISRAGDDLLTIDTNGLVRIYSCQKLLGEKIESAITR